MSWILIACILGLVEGFTEFLPVSSTGHLILAENLLGFTGPTADSLTIFIQLGAILAVVVAYHNTFLDLLRPPQAPGFSGWSGIRLLVLTTLPALAIGPLLIHYIKANLFNATTVAIGLAVGSIWIILAERYYRHHNPQSLDTLRWRGALAIGFFQCLAMWPGMSRSTCTILGGMMCGLDRKSSTEYSFFAAVPMICAASAYELIKFEGEITTQILSMFGLGFVVSFASALLAIRFLIRFVSHNTLTPFAWYRLAVAGLVLWLM